MSHHWMQTLSGGVFEAYDPTPEQINIEDVAHALSMLCRFNGHVPEFYSVAQHSVLVSMLVPEDVALEGLLHDATEAYIGDMPSPIKRGLPEFIALENNIYQKAIAPKFGLPDTMSQAVKFADKLALFIEKRFLLTEYGLDWNLGDLGIPEGMNNLVPLHPHLARSAFMNRYRELTKSA